MRTKKSLLNNLLAILAVILQTGVTNAQQSFKFRVAIDSVTQDGFYKILLPPKITGLSQPGFNDVRILDHEKDQVPYLLQTDAARFATTHFVEFAILSVKKEADKQTHITIKNKDRWAINHLVLVTKNTSATRYISLSGSDDNKQWFVIKENILLSNPGEDSDSSTQILSFPTNNYIYFQITIVGENLLPVNIVKIGVYTEKLSQGTFVQLPEPMIVQKDSTDRKTYVQVLFDQVYNVEKIDIQSTGPLYFRRPLNVSANGFVNPNEAAFFISSSQANSYNFHLRTKEILFSIDNGDNTPIIVHAIKAWQLNRFLITYLKKGNRYALYFGNSTLSAPEYDLAFFKDSIQNVPLKGTGHIQFIGANTVKPSPVFNMRLLWILIVIILALLFFFTIRMAKEVQKKTPEID